MNKCVRHPEEDALVRHLDHGWLCVDCAANEGYPLAIQLQAAHLIEVLMEPIQQIGGIQ